MERVDFSAVDLAEDEERAIDLMYRYTMKNQVEKFHFDAAPEGSIVIRTKATYVERGTKVADARLDLTLQWVEGGAVLETKAFSKSIGLNAMGIGMTGGYSGVRRLQAASKELAEEIADFMRRATRG